jgi:hypothetical protein
MELNIKTYVGMGDILHSKQLLDEVKDNYDTINVYYDKDCFEWKGNYNQFSEFTEKLFKELFSEPPYVIQDTPYSVSLSPINLARHINSQFKVLNFEKYFCKDLDDSQEVEDYFVVLTKIRGWHYSNYCSIKEKYLDILNKISLKNKIYIMGERKIGLNKENELHGPQLIYSIYDDLIQNISNVKDLTVPELGITAAKYNDFINDCKIMNRSKNVICFGVSGSIDMAMSVSNIVNYYGHSEAEDMFNLMPKQKDKYLTNNLTDFFEKLESLI